MLSFPCVVTNVDPRLQKPPAVHPPPFKKQQTTGTENPTPTTTHLRMNSTKCENIWSADVCRDICTPPQKKKQGTASHSTQQPAGVPARRDQINRELHQRGGERAIRTCRYECRTIMDHGFGLAWTGGRGGRVSDGRRLAPRGLRCTST